MGNRIGNYIKGTDHRYLLACIGSSIFAVVVLCSIGYKQLGGLATDEISGEVIGLGGYRRAVVQGAVSVLGVILAVILSKIKYRDLANLWPMHAALCWGLVLPTLVLHNVSIGPVTIGFDAGGTDNYSWYKIGGFTFQPTELAKISFILTFALHLYHERDRLNEPLKLIGLLLHLIAPILLIHKQGDDGTAIIYGFIGACMLFCAGLAWRYILAAVTVAVAGGGAAFFFFSDKIGKSYQWTRIMAVIDPNNTTGWAATEQFYKDTVLQQASGELAIGSGRIFGQGLFTQEYVYVPNAYNDFVFSWIGNAVGFVGAGIVLVVLFYICGRALATGLRSNDTLGCYICVGVAAAMFAQIVVNLGMNLRVLPVIGVTLPFYSAGGSSVIMLYLCVGLVLSVYMNQEKGLFASDL